MLLLAIVELFLVNSVWGNYNGPFVFFGHEKLGGLKSPALSEPDASFLIDLYNKSPAIVVFTRNISSKITADNFPAFKELLSKTKHSYITAHQLTVDPIEYNANTEVNNSVPLPLRQIMETH